MRPVPELPEPEDERTPRSRGIRCDRVPESVGEQEDVTWFRYHGQSIRWHFATCERLIELVDITRRYRLFRHTFVTPWNQKEVPGVRLRDVTQEDLRLDLQALTTSREPDRLEVLTTIGVPRFERGLAESSNEDLGTKYLDATTQNRYEWADHPRVVEELGQLGVVSDRVADASRMSSVCETTVGRDRRCIKLHCIRDDSLPASDRLIIEYASEVYVTELVEIRKLIWREKPDIIDAQRRPPSRRDSLSDDAEQVGEPLFSVVSVCPRQQCQNRSRMPTDNASVPPID